MYIYIFVSTPTTYKRIVFNEYSSYATVTDQACMFFLLSKSLSRGLFLPHAFTILQFSKGPTLIQTRWVLLGVLEGNSQVGWWLGAPWLELACCFLNHMEQTCKSDAKVLHHV